ncbi:MAG TPA: UDP-N-acetylglucosamine 2-epimerase, partial [Candidatus Limnocylindria bacterium]|nr:UDP-N-acetylglucosamine 2-epimerase [Candidatus Limnocylindria bacterium]
YPVIVRPSRSALSASTAHARLDVGWAGVPCITLRAETEWTETLEAGWNRLAGSDPALVGRLLADAAFMDRTRPRPALFGDGRSAERVVAALEDLDRGRGAGA